jgi:hypothetical protein
MNMPQERKPQQQTVSVRVSEAMREYLDRARETVSNGREAPVSTSQVIKMLLEQAMANAPDDGLEAAELLRNPTEALLGIRAKWEQQECLSRAEWIVVARYVEAGCEESHEDSRVLARESLVDLVKAVLALLKATAGESRDRDWCHLKKSRAPARVDRRYSGAAKVCGIGGSLMRELRDSESAMRPTLVGRTLYAVLRDKEFTSVIAINQALRPFLSTLFRLAARGHWLQEHRPVRLERKTSEVREHGLRTSVLSPVCAGEFQLTTLLTADGDLAMTLDMTSREAVYPLGPFPQIRELAALLEQLRPGSVWKGREFLGYTNACECHPVRRFYFCQRSNGIAFGFSPDEWNELRGVFRQTLGSPAMVPILAELSMEYGSL